MISHVNATGLFFFLKRVSVKQNKKKRSLNDEKQDVTRDIMYLCKRITDKNTNKKESKPVHAYLILLKFKTSE